MQELDLLGRPLEDALEALQSAGYAVEVQESSANSVLRSPLRDDFCRPGVLRVRFVGQSCQLLYSKYKELSV